MVPVSRRDTSARTSSSAVTATGSLVRDAILSTSPGSPPPRSIQTPSAPISFHITAHSDGSFCLPENISAARSGYLDRSSVTSPKTRGLRCLAPSRSRNGRLHAPPAT